ncbi:SUMF1/EgtB/PvdO family nonheme iron enzyme [Methylobacterium nigriterrae]|uniref:SUMF1/EgtB/PvdO family nonheme iron enzyme n=1 Tax=Methylobacterium nigriterrae TaxID=3127512 RepID=UPI003013F107
MLVRLALIAVTLLLADLASAQGTTGTARRFALLIANVRYPDANVPLPTVGKDARSLADELRRNDFDVELRENLTREDAQSALDAFYAKINAGSAALFYFGGFGIQVGRQSYLLPVNAQIWSETETRRDSINLDTVLTEMNRRGAQVKIAIVDAARSNPYERRFRASSAGLAPVDAPEGTLVLLAAPPGKVVRDGSGDLSLFMGELLKELRTPNLTAEEAFAHTRMGVSRASNAEQVPWVASSLMEEFHFSKPTAAGIPSSPGPVVRAPDDAAQPRTGRQRAPAAAPAQQSSASPIVAPSPPPTPPAPAQPQLAALPPPAPVPPAASQTGQSFRDCGDCPEMVVLPAGSFEMGSSAAPFERPVHRVTIAKPFAIARYETTVDEWNRCVESGACKFRPPEAGPGSGNKPVTNVSWYDAKDYAGWLSAKTHQTYRLPTEAEWEYAAHGGTGSAFAWGPQVGVAKANCRDCRPGTSPQILEAGHFPPNGYGLFDLAGNAAEWVEDCWNDDYRGAPQDGKAWMRGNCSQRVLRGGSFDSAASYVKPSARFRYDADVRYYANGFRVVRTTP